jgi:diguanylate cyclase (GGDEF)-like protein
MDLVTGLADDRESDAWLVERATKGAPLVIAVLDIDRFRDFNDRRGHVAGNDLLMSLADLIRDAADLVGRFGGDEFVLAWTADDTTKAIDEIEQVGSRFREQTGLTLSAGVAALRGVDESAAADASRSLIAAADQALYDAKGAGGDCIRVSRT